MGGVWQRPSGSQEVQAVEPTPKGTYGRGLPKVLLPIFKVMMGLSVATFGLYGKRGRVMGRPLLRLTTVGVRSGKRRRTVLGWFPGDDNTWTLVGSGAGSARHPAWCINLVRHPDQVWVEAGGRKLKVTPRLLQGAEREEAWKSVVSLSPGYGNYQKATDREIPVIRLRAEE